MENVCCLKKSLRLVFVANISCNLDYVAYKLLLINHTACTVVKGQLQLQGKKDIEITAARAQSELQILISVYCYSLSWIVVEVLASFPILYC